MNKEVAMEKLNMVLKEDVKVINLVTFTNAFISAVVYDGKSDFPQYIILSLNTYGYPYKSTVYNLTIDSLLGYDSLDILKSDYKKEIGAYYKNIESIYTEEGVNLI